MPETRAQKWNQRYQTAELSTPAEACWLLKQHIRCLPLRGQALDLASGLAGNARFLARCGLSTQAWDISETATDLVSRWAKLQGLTHLQAHCKDIAVQDFVSNQFDVIVVSHYLDRTIMDNLAQSLKPKGWLFYQTFLAPTQAAGPSNPDFYIQPSEYQAYWPSLNCEVYGEGWIKSSDNRLMREAWYIGRKL
ncbi:MAG: class I SAM-dependent methyltransferase [Thiomicrospira sp.]|uniref:class I SAM-dependent methyltransferase n=1 Tax=Thiomicrospira sp. TaxID=935 RepID=UPI001A07EC4B|nr:class I SAM-dependent methyltransferase [Thiomicrospira sp.]MBE0493064.1 class I SAM-dependent methyltransferase [Thiomicrospira sp.]